MKKRKKNNRLVIGVTGSFATGKSTVARMLGRLGAQVLDADAIAHRMILPGTPGQRMVSKRFGSRIVGRGGRIDRRRLGKMIFSEPRKRRQLERILHPLVIAGITDALARPKRKVVVLDAPLLLEAGLAGLVDKLVVVACSKDTQLKRIQKKYGLTPGAARQRIRCQMPLSRKIRVADFVIDNNSTLEQTRKQVAELRRKWWKS